MISRSTESSRCSVQVTVPKYKRRKVSAVRDFPVGCGPNVPLINVRPRNEFTTGGGDQKPISPSKMDCILNKAIWDAPEVSEPKDVVLLKSSNNVCVDTSPCDYVKIPEPKDLKLVKILREVCVDTSNCYIDSGPHSEHTCDSVVVVQRMGRKYPPRRKISAVRDFPLHCGSNAQCLTKEKCVQGRASSKRDSSGVLKLSNENLQSDQLLKLGPLYSGISLQADRQFRGELGHDPSLNSADKSPTLDQFSDLKGTPTNCFSRPYFGNTNQNPVLKLCECVLPQREHSSGVETKGVDIQFCEKQAVYQNGVFNSETILIGSDDENEKVPYHPENDSSANKMEDELAASDAVLLEQVVSKIADGMAEMDSREQCVNVSDLSSPRYAVHSLTVVHNSRKIDDHMQDKLLTREQSQSIKNSAGREIVHALVAAPKLSKGVTLSSRSGYPQTSVRKEVIDLTREQPHLIEKSANCQIVYALKAAPKWSKGVTLSSRSGCTQMNIPMEVRDLTRHHSQSIEDSAGREIVHALMTEPKGKEIVVHSNTSDLERELSSKNTGSRMTVLALMAATNCPWKQSKGVTHSFPRGIQIGRHMKPGSNMRKHKMKKLFDNRRALMVVAHNKKGKSDFIEATPLHSYQRPIIMDEDVIDSSEQDGGSDEFYCSHRYCEIDLPPVVPNNAKFQKCSTDHVTSNQVRDTLRLFQAVYRKLMHEEEAISRASGCKRVDLMTAALLKEQGKYINTKQVVGPVDGVDIGLEFQFRVELAIVGLHRLFQAGIDYMNQDGKLIATSIVASGGYANELGSSNELIYFGSGGNPSEDQKLERGNLALKNSIAERNPVRVIRGHDHKVKPDSSDPKTRIAKTYTYDGLYVVTKYCQEIGAHGKLVFKFHLDRIPGQPDVSWEISKKLNKSKVCERLCLQDISEGKELFPISVINTIDEQRPPSFKYITSMAYPDWCRPLPLRGCNCVGGCSDSPSCSCAVKNGGEIPYNFNGSIVEAKPLVYECGSSCKCPPNCPNRVSQHGIKIQLEVFKTEARGWGVRSPKYITSGSFICEYLGELLDNKQAEQRIGSDEYLFDIGPNFSDHNLLDEFSNLKYHPQIGPSEVVDDIGFTIDAEGYGNVGRFINHSCSPNLYAQNVLYDHEDRRIPHIMLFAAENIPPLQELTYHYNYQIGEVLDANNNEKIKLCFCGSDDCSGRLY